MKIASLFMAAALAATACGSGDGGDSSNGGGSNGDPVEAPDAAYGGVLTMGLEAETTGGWCIPTNQYAASGIQVTQAIYDSLFAFDENLDPQPMLAESVEVNDANDTFTIKLREGVTFHNGETLNAELVKMNLDIWTNGYEGTLPYTPLLLPITLANVEGISKVDEMTIAVKTKTPWPAFIDYLATGRSSIAAKEQLLADDCAEHPIGSGPFVAAADAWKRNDEFVLTRNEDYWRTAENGDQLPYLDGITFKPFPSSEDRLNALIGGSINALHTSTFAAMDDIANTDGFATYVEPEGNQEIAYGLNNTANPPMDNAETRRAIGMAIDRNILNDINSNGEFRVAEQPFDTEVMGHVDGLILGEYNPEEAKKLLDGKDISFELKYATDPITKQIAEEVKRQLEQVGVTVNITELEQSALIDTALGGDFSTLLWRNHPGADPDTQYLWWHSTAITNFGKLNDPVIDEALDKGRVETDPAKRAEYYQTVSQQMADESYFLWNWYSTWAYGFADDVHGMGTSRLPDGQTGAGMHWGWGDLSGVYIAE